MDAKSAENQVPKNTSRQALLDAARKLFIEKGYEAVSTRELAESAGVNLGAIQYHFGSKAQLFVQTIQCLMQDSGCEQARTDLEASLGSKIEAGRALCEFINGFMNYLLRPVGPQACRLMFREVLSDSSRDEEMFEVLVSSVVAEFSKPLENTLVSVLKVINPKLSISELELSAQSVMGQCSFYLTHRPFIERIRGSDLSCTPRFEDTVRHICSFSLRALGCGQDFIDEVVSYASAN